MSTFDKQKFGRRLKEMRLKAGYERQIDLAKKLGTVVQTISNYESGSRLPDAEMLARIVEVLPCNADYLLGFEDKPTYAISFILEQTGLSQKAIEVLFEGIRSAKERKGDKSLESSLVSQFITSDQFSKLVELHEECAGFVLTNEILKYDGSDDDLDDVDRAILRLFEGEMKGIGGKERFDLYIFAAKHQAMELYGEFFKTAINEIDMWIGICDDDGNVIDEIGNIAKRPPEIMPTKKA
ncbi:hypothetical protein SDC9_66355 [bioreactor metagenome]|uniref:HTH cro/C1-type domain-containing protein n=1 Tax=bioreactor metagenome TaxID=1076179 RepID=A0A644XVX5_9ZZZZ